MSAIPTAAVIALVIVVVLVIDLRRARRLRATGAPVPPAMLISFVALGIAAVSDAVLFVSALAG